ncbi:cytochrome c biogenesis protein ResB [Lysinibacillus sp. NPDC048646]|uniref:cytochrome c biogenesis protein ResB n=1 Tax=Lysinibacillus sp. NPDC048646 TaxID=3390574 RepID=UPI003D049D15
MNRVKCVCGHVNPHGTNLCEACGRSLGHNEKTDNKLVDMRYEGVARRSEIHKKSFIDKVWTIFSSVKFAICLLFITLVASAIGSLLPQEKNTVIPFGTTVEQFFEEEYGVFGAIFYMLGFHKLYGTWWYITLVFLVAASLIICSLDRFVPLYRALKKQRVERSNGFMKRQRFFSSTKIASSKVNMTELEQRLKKHHYNVRIENQSLLAEKGLFSRWGPYINHIGLIIFIAGCMLRLVPGIHIEESLAVREGDTVVIPGTDGAYYFKNKEFIVEMYDEEDNKAFASALEKNNGSIIKSYTTHGVLYKSVSETIAGATPELEEITEYDVMMNKPLKFDGYAIYQMGYDAQFSEITFALQKKENANGKPIGTITVDLMNPERTYDLGDGYVVVIEEYLPDFSLDEDEQPTSLSANPNNPFILFKMITPESPDGETIYFTMLGLLEPNNSQNNYALNYVQEGYDYITYLLVKKDLMLPVLFVGGTIFIIGVMIGSFWYHRRVWITVKEDEVFIASHTNKNYFGLRRELEKVLEELPLTIPEDQLVDNKKK